MSTCFSMDVRAFICLCVYLDSPNLNIYLFRFIHYLEMPVCFSSPIRADTRSLIFGWERGYFSGSLPLYVGPNSPEEKVGDVHSGSLLFGLGTHLTRT